MFNVKTILLVTGLAGLTCQPQAWAITDKDDFDTSDKTELAHLPISPEQALEKPQGEPPGVATQFKMEQEENKRLKALKTALRAENKKLKAKLAALQTAQSALAPALTPTISQTYKDPEHGLKKPDKKTKKKARKALRLKNKKKK